MGDLERSFEPFCESDHDSLALNVDSLCDKDCRAALPIVWAMFEKIQLLFMAEFTRNEINQRRLVAAKAGFLKVTDAITDLDCSQVQRGPAVHRLEKRAEQAKADCERLQAELQLVNAGIATCTKRIRSVLGDSPRKGRSLVEQSVEQWKVVSLPNYYDAKCKFRQEEARQARRIAQGDRAIAATACGYAEGTRSAGRRPRFD